jgi:capsular polysaccharide transport system permease protein
MGGLGSMLAGTGLATSQDSVTVQSFLMSREAMRRLDAEHGFKAYFQRPEIDPLRRLAPDATNEDAYRLYQDMVQVSYDPTEGIVRMEVIAADPETSERFARALVTYAEEQVDSLTQRLRENQMRDAVAGVAEAEVRAREAQMRVLELQENFQVLSSEVEVTLLTQQITTLEGQLNQERLSLADLRANARPTSARLAQTERRIATLEGQIAELRGTLTQGNAEGSSLARVQRELVMAEADVATRQLLLQQSMSQLEAARLEANRQVRYLSMGVSPIAPDEATYPRAFENTALAFLIFGGIYLMLSMTGSILREQVTA